MKTAVFHFLQFFRRPVLMVLSLLKWLFALGVIMFLVMGSREGSYPWGAIIAMALMSFAAHMARYYYDRLVLRLTPKGLDLTLYQ